MKTVRFFATNADIYPILSKIEDEMPLMYIKSGLFKTKNVDKFLTAKDIPNLGIMSDEHEPDCDTFLVTARNANVEIRSIKQNNGSVLFAVDELSNPDSLTFRPAGMLGNDVIISGTLGSTSDMEISNKVIKTFSNSIKKQFKKVGAFWVGQEAYSMLLAGKRLTGATQSPREYDLKIG